MLRAQVNGPHQYNDLHEIIAQFGHSYHAGTPGRMDSLCRTNEGHLKKSD